MFAFFNLGPMEILILLLLGGLPVLAGVVILIVYLVILRKPQSGPGERADEQRRPPAP